jgi:DNA-binding transcriptional regulator YhcF (GntR family)
MPKKLAQENPGPLERLFGSSMARLIDFFTLYDQWDYSKTDIAENVEVSIRTVTRAVPYLEQHGMIKRTRTVGNAEMYQTNKESPIIQYLSKAAMAIADIDVDQELKRQGYTKDAQPKQPELKQETQTAPTQASA